MQCLSHLAARLWFSAPPTEKVQRAVREVFGDDRIQQEYPGDRNVSLRREPIGSDDSWDWPDIASSPVVEALVWTLIVVGVVLAGFWLYTRLSGYRRDVAVAPTGVGEVAPAPEAPIADAKALAAEGRYTEAVHALLMRAMADLGRRGALAGSLTSREVLSRTKLPPASHTAMTGLVGAVELALFGGRPADSATYGAARDQYQQFARHLETAKA